MPSVLKHSLPAAALLCTALAASPGRAATVADTLEKAGVLGEWSVSCAAPPSRTAPHSSIEKTTAADAIELFDTGDPAPHRVPILTATLTDTWFGAPTITIVTPYSAPALEGEQTATYAVQNGTRLILQDAYDFKVLADGLVLDKIERHAGDEVHFPVVKDSKVITTGKDAVPLQKCTSPGGAEPSEYDLKTVVAETARALSSAPFDASTLTKTRCAYDGDMPIWWCDYVVAGQPQRGGFVNAGGKWQEKF